MNQRTPEKLKSYKRSDFVKRNREKLTALIQKKDFRNDIEMLNQAITPEDAKGLKKYFEYCKVKGIVSPRLKISHPEFIAVCKKWGLKSISIVEDGYVFELEEPLELIFDPQDRKVHIVLAEGDYIQADVNELTRLGMNVKNGLLGKSKVRQRGRKKFKDEVNKRLYQEYNERKNNGEHYLKVAKDLKKQKEYKDKSIGTIVRIGKNHKEYAPECDK